MAAAPQEPRQSPPWAGPAFTPVIANTRTPLEQPEEYPFADAKTVNPDLFPPVCIRSHWDAERIIRRTLPNSPALSLPLDPRPWTKVCLEYTTSGDFEEAPRPGDHVVFPSGGTFYPPTRYREGVDTESELRRLERPLGLCERDQYVPSRLGNMYKPNSTVPDRGPQTTRFVEELSFPKACMRAGDYECRAEAQGAAWERSTNLFNNATKQDRYTEMRKGLTRGKEVPQQRAEDD
jgi:hypothetical protein